MNRNTIRAFRDVVLLVALAWVGVTVLLDRQRRRIGAPITLGDIVIAVVYIAWFLGSVVAMRIARKRHRSGWAWFIIAYTVSPLLALVMLKAFSSEAGSLKATATHTDTVDPRGPKGGAR